MFTSNIYVPDASVILKWIFDTPEEADRDRALALLNSWVAGECEFVLPTLWLYEVGNIIGRNVPDRAADLMTLLIDYRITEAPVTPSYCRAHSGNHVRLPSYVLRCRVSCHRS